jgi:hypothetical protein
MSGSWLSEGSTTYSLPKKRIWERTRIMMMITTTIPMNKAHLRFSESLELGEQHMLDLAPSSSSSY